MGLIYLLIFLFNPIFIVKLVKLKHMLSKHRMTRVVLLISVVVSPLNNILQYDHKKKEKAMMKNHNVACSRAKSGRLLLNVYSLSVFIIWLTQQ